MIRTVLVIALLGLAACGADGEPIRPGSAEDIAEQQARAEADAM
ncbi:hypothetical protein [Aliiroseovarius sp. 2305UL8-7]